MESKYEFLVEKLSQEIMSGKFAHVELLPSERALALRFDVARETIRRVLQELRRRGFIRAKQGSGTYLTHGGRHFRETIGLILTDARRSEIVDEICAALRKLCLKMGLKLLYANATASDDESRAEKAVSIAREFAEKKVAGVILQPVEFSEKAEAYNRKIENIFSSASIPFVLIDCDLVNAPERSSYDVVATDNFQAGRMIGQHLAAQGERFALFVAQAHFPNTISERLSGLESVLFVTRAILPDLQPETLKSALANTRVRAVVCQNDRAAVSVLAALKQLDVSVPEDMCVAGFDDVACAAITDPPLTTIRQPCRYMASRAFDRLIARIRGATYPAEKIIVQPTLIVRQSTRRNQCPTDPNRTAINKAKSIPKLDMSHLRHIVAPHCPTCCDSVTK